MNSSGVTIGISRKGLSASRSRSPENDQVRMPVDGQLQKLVVCGIATRCDALADRHQLGGREHLGQTFEKRRACHGNQVGPLKDANDFLLGCSGFEQAAM
jgi:hypothetical protein